MKILTEIKKCKFSLKKKGKVIEEFRKATISWYCDGIIKEMDKEFDKVEKDEWQTLLKIAEETNKHIYNVIYTGLVILGKIHDANIEKRRPGLVLIKPYLFGSHDTERVLKYFKRRKIIEDFKYDRRLDAYKVVLSPKYRRLLKEAIEEEVNWVIRRISCTGLKKAFKYTKCEVESHYPIFRARFHEKYDYTIYYRFERILKDYYKCIKQVIEGKTENIKGLCSAEKNLYLPYNLPLEFRKESIKALNFIIALSRLTLVNIENIHEITIYKICSFSSMREKDIQKDIRKGMKDPKTLQILRKTPIISFTRKIYSKVPYPCIASVIAFYELFHFSEPLDQIGLFLSDDYNFFTYDILYPKVIEFRFSEHFEEVSRDMEKYFSTIYDSVFMDLDAYIVAGFRYFSF